MARFVREHPAAVLATGGSIVTARETHRLLRRHFVTVWLRALLVAREPLYAQAHQVIDTSRTGVKGAVDHLARELHG